MTSEVEKQIDELLSDPLLIHLPKDVTLDEAEKNIALLKGQAFELTVIRPNLKNIFYELKSMIRLQAERELREVSSSKVNWKYIWRTYCLCLHKPKIDDASQILKPDRAKIKDLGLNSSTSVYFVKYLCRGKRKTRFSCS